MNDDWYVVAVDISGVFHLYGPSEKSEAHDRAGDLYERFPLEFVEIDVTQAIRNVEV